MQVIFSNNNYCFYIFPKAIFCFNRSLDKTNGRMSCLDV